MERVSSWRRAKNASRRFVISVDVELGNRSDVASDRNRPSLTHEAVEQSQKLRGSLTRDLNVRQRTQRQERHLIRMVARQLDHQLRGLAWMVRFRSTKAAIPHPRRAVQVRCGHDRRTDRNSRFARRRFATAHTRSFRRIEFLQNAENVARRLPPRHPAPSRRDRKDVELRIDQRDGDRQGIPDSGVCVDDDLL